MRCNQLIISSFVVAMVPFLAAQAEARSCFSGKEAVSQDQIKSEKDDFKSDPSGWFGKKGGGLSKAVRDLAGSDPDFAATIVSFHKGVGGGAAREQGSAIGAGLGQAVLACKDFTDEAGKIQTAASSSSEDSVVASFNSTIGSAQTGAVGAGAGGGAGGGDGSGIGGATTQAASSGGGGSSRGEPGSTAPVANRTVSLLTITPGSSSPASATPTTTTTNTTIIQAGQAATTNP